MRIVMLWAVLLCAAAPGWAQSGIDALIEAEKASLGQLYLYLHQHPELSFHEKDTAARLVTEMKSAGFEVTPNLGGYGFVAVLRNGTGPTVMVRTDLDGLPVEEKTGRSYASKVRTTNDQGQDVGVMHACGHDIHMSSFVGVARVLSTTKDRWKGTLVMIGQPAEERGSGATAMLKDGLYTRFPRPDVALALHTDAALESGKIGYRAGFAMANVDTLDLTVKGVGGHGAYPHLTKDPIVLSAQIILALQTLVSRELRPIDSGVVTVGSIHGGSKHNIIPDQVNLQLTVRSYSDQTREQLLSGIRRIAVNTARAAGVPEDRLPTMKLQDQEFTPATYNDPELVKRLVAMWKTSLGADRVVERDPEMGGEDFSRYGRETPRIPIFLMRVGTVDAERMAAAARGETPLPSLHSPLYWPAIHPTLETGVKAMSLAVLELMKK